MTIFKYDLLAIFAGILAKNTQKIIVEYELNGFAHNYLIFGTITSLQPQISDAMETGGYKECSYSFLDSHQ